MINALDKIFNDFSVPIVHKITAFYKEIYLINKKIPKRDRFGLQAKIEENCLNCLDLSLEAALESKLQKEPIIKKLRIKIESIKHLLRLSYELNIIKSTIYLSLSQRLEEISKMSAGWLKYSAMRSSNN